VSVLVLNAGSSSLKFALIEADGHTRRLSGKIDGLPERPQFKAKGPGIAHDQPLPAGLTAEGALDALFDWLSAHELLAGVRAVGHRVVHGGGEYSAPVRVDGALLERLEAFAPLAPLHQGANLAPIRRLLATHPELPQIACFDTAFHAGIDAIEQRYAIPEALHAAGIRRYGFHGLSYEWIAARLPEFDPHAAAGRTVVMHLGQGASLCALLGGRSVATSMGFSTLAGVPMATRPGDLDPGILLHLLAQGHDAATLERLLYRESGWVGVSGISADMRMLLASEEPAARLAIELFVHRVVQCIGALAATLGGLDALVFTAGIGENAAPIRAAVLARLAWLGVNLDETANNAGGPPLTSDGSRVRAWVIPTDEEAVIAGHTLRLCHHP
jgi:acetate kinase